MIKAKKKGSCYIYVYTQDGLSKKITGTVTSVTDEDGNDISTEVKRKQFYTIVTADGQQYYLVIDMSAAYTDDDGVNVTPDDGTVYFLTSVSNQCLLINLKNLEFADFSLVICYNICKGFNKMKSFSLQIIEEFYK